MKTWMAFLHGLVIAAINIFAILFGFLVYNLARPANQLLVQGTTAVVVSIGLTLLWAWLTRQPRQGRWALSAAPALGVFAAALVWMVVIFLPLHLATQGYMSSFGNILAGWAFQAPVNAVGLALVHRPSIRVWHMRA